jgi:hypothetical protein
VFPERLVELVAGTTVVVLASVWLLQKRPELRRWRPLLGVWLLAWAGAAGFGYVALLRAQAALTSGPVEERLERFGRWLERASTSRLVAMAVLLLGLVTVFVVWARREAPGRGGGGG